MNSYSFSFTYAKKESLTFSDRGFSESCAMTVEACGTLEIEARNLRDAVAALNEWVETLESIETLTIGNRTRQFSDWKF